MPVHFLQAQGGGGSGSGGDLLSTLLSAEVALTGTTSLTGSAFGVMHTISGTSADYTITLPAVSGNAGKFIGFRVLAAASASKLYTLDGNSSEVIDGATTRILWALETAILLCDGAAWFKVAGRTIPLLCQIKRTTNQTIADSTNTKAQCGTLIVDNLGTQADTANNRIVVRRAGRYNAFAMCQYANMSIGGIAYQFIYVNSVDVGPPAFQSNLYVATGYPVVFFSTTLPAALAVGDVVENYVAHYDNVGAPANQTLSNAGLGILEVPQW
jgi:hypothetical protein